MKDLIEMGYEAQQIAGNNKLKYSVIFAEKLMKELGNMKSEDIAPCLSCSYNVMSHTYKIELNIHDSLCVSDTAIGDVK